jgi:hypothetical protein
MKLSDEGGQWARRSALVLLFGFLLFAPLGAVLAHNNAGAGILAGVGIAAIIMTRLQDLISFSGLGIKAELAKKVAEVDEIIKQLQTISKALARVSLQEMAMAGQMLYRVLTEVKFKARDDIATALQKIGIPQHEIIETHEVWIEVFGTILLNMIVADAANASSFLAAQQQVSKLPRIGTYDLPSPDALQLWAAHKTGENLSQLCQEYRRLIETGGMAKPELIPFNSALGARWLSSKEAEKTDLDK